ncbi:unnamed protein product [Cuscuta europaea]|uniref:Uncharacterized protein n=1 Tax=Cuscuta europaea TaxID=41803 RepID=A0A9P1E1F7_CUSEU|nr:unnamed protein product [Cuscuta europaea]
MFYFLLILFFLGPFLGRRNHKNASNFIVFFLGPFLGESGGLPAIDGLFGTINFSEIDSPTSNRIAYTTKTGVGRRPLQKLHPVAYSTLYLCFFFCYLIL